MPKIAGEYTVWPDASLPAYSEHADHTFCYDMSCPCHENLENINQLGDAVSDGLASTGDADRIYRGRTV